MQRSELRCSMCCRCQMVNQRRSFQRGQKLQTLEEELEEEEGRHHQVEEVVLEEEVELQEIQS